MATENSFNLESTRFVNTFLRTDGNIVNCQYTAGPWERWQIIPLGTKPGFFLQSVQFPGSYLCVLQGIVTITHSKAEATDFNLILCDPNDTSKVAVQASTGLFVTISSGMSAFNGAGGGAVQLLPFSPEAIFDLMPANYGNQPQVKQVDVTSHPPIPTGLKATYLQNPNSLDPADRCDVLVWNELTYWAYSYTDNRVGMAILAYDASNQLVQRWDQDGARYLWKITVDADNQTVQFIGQASQAITMTWDSLKVG